ncbi:hypothetical protein EVG20_g1297 [Dentipellis fragilis]|uniref:AMP-dependent synthetase/ligase domain-containing protein n=1 Tax=Dentipellis fragilis TaxID=205917 RepID=A0A4Y9ZD23_9AGAM|nr:hypothetical protein EVG20_g1297 [Dentipellis fragilis]
MPHLKSLYPPIPYVKISNYYEWLVTLDSVKNLPDFTLYIDGLTGERRQLGEVFDRVALCATALSAPPAEGGMGITETPDEVVGLFSENTMEYPTAVYSLLKIAVPFALLPAYLTVSELAALITLSDLTRLFISPNLQDTALKAAKQADFPLDRIYVVQGHIQGFQSLNDFIEVAPIMVSHKNLYYSAMQVLVCVAELYKTGKIPSLAHTPEGVSVGVAFQPFYHASGLHFSIMRNLVMPTTSVIVPNWDVDRMLEAVEKYRATHLVMIPSMTHRMIFSPRFKDMDFSSVMWFITAAAHLAFDHRKAVLERLSQTPDITNIYGLTECTVSALQLPLPGLFVGRFSDTVLSTMTGILLPGMEARILRDDGSEADFDEPGELLLRGGNVTMGYKKNEEASAKTFLEDGWFRTGDRFTVSKGGAFFYSDRLEDMLIVSGLPVSPSEIEHVLWLQPDKLFVDVAVAGVPGDRCSDEKVPRAWIVLSDVGRQRGSTAVVSILDEWARSQMGGDKTLQGGIEVVEQLAESAGGKVSRRLLQAKYMQALEGSSET